MVPIMTRRVSRKDATQAHKYRGALRQGVGFHLELLGLKQVVSSATPSMLFGSCVVVVG